MSSEGASADNEQAKRDYREKYTGKPGPFEKANWFKLTFFTWLDPMISTTYKIGEFDQNMHYDLRPQDTSEVVSKDFEANWKKVYTKGFLEPGTKTPYGGFFKTIWLTFKWHILLGLFVGILVSAAEYFDSYIIYQAIKQVTEVSKEGPVSPVTDGTSRLERYKYVIIYLSIMVSSKIIMTLVNQAVGFQISLLGLKIRNTINLFIYKKIQRKSMERDLTFSMGEITNLTQVDANKFTSISRVGTRVILIPFEVTFGIFMLYKLMGHALWPALGILIVVLIINFFLGRMYKKFHLLTMDVKDKRGKLVNETFKNIRFIKMNGLESMYIRKVVDIKNEEISLIRKNQYRMLVSSFVNSLGPFLFMTTLYSFHLYWTGKLKLEDAFVSSIVFGIFQYTFRAAVFIVLYVVEIIVAGKRISFFLLSEEIDDSHIERLPKEAPNAIEVKSGNFYWTDKLNAKYYKEEKDRVSEKEKRDKIKGIKKDDEKSSKKSTISSKNLQGSDTESLKSSLLKASFVPDDVTLGNEDGQKPEESRYDLVLKNIEMSIPKGSCVAIIGKVGSGKSSLLSALIGDLYAEKGTNIKVAGDVGYVSQKAWILSKTVKDNITFGEQIDEKRLEDAIEYSCLKDDLKIMEKGVETVLGDRGVNLSGGQKMRLAIARAFYTEKDVYLFDDPISALDIHVGKKVMEEGILKFLKGKTRIVNTHALSYLPYFDYIYILDEGKIIDHGTYQDLQKSNVFLEIKQSLQKVDKAEDSPETGVKNTKEKPKEKTKGDQKNSGMGQATLKTEVPPPLPQLTSNLSTEERKQNQLIQDIISMEDKSKGSVGWGLVHQYIIFSGGYWLVIPITLTLICWMFFSFGSNWFLQYWTTSHDNPKDIKTFVTVFVLLNLGETLANLLRMFIFYFSNQNLSREVNFLMTFRLMHASVNKFFDRVPIGRILNRFLKDSDMIDSMLAMSAGSMVFSIAMCIVDLSVTTFTSSPIIIPFFFMYVYFSYKVQRRYLMLQRDITRLRSITSSPMIQCFSEGVQGNSTIRAFGKQDFSVNEYTHSLNEFQKNCIIDSAIYRWFTVRLTLLSNLVIVPSLLMVVLFLEPNAGKFALLIRYLLFTMSDIDNLLDSAADFENRSISLERCLYFVGVEPEIGYKTLPVMEEKMRHGYNIRIGKQNDWPSDGEIVVRDLRVRYRSDLPEVLKGINLTVPHGCKVGIVGRTGAGKTTLISTLYRNFDDYQGSITFSGRELRDIDLKALRTNITIIPQDPYIFQATLRENLDPIESCLDHEIEDILKEVRLWDKFAKEKGLKSEIEQGGANLSQGEKQLLCLARALLLKNKLVIMDEATANIDSQTEQIIQRLLKEKFTDCTLFMIAHRLNTVLGCDKVLTLDQGQVIEFDDLQKLVSDPESHFGQMLAKAEELSQNLG